MRLAKLLMVTVLMLSIVGAAVAYKSRFVGKRVFVQTSFVGPCNIRLTGFYTTTADVLVTFMTFSTFASAGSCLLYDRVLRIE